MAHGSDGTCSQKPVQSTERFELKNGTSGLVAGFSLPDQHRLSLLSILAEEASDSNDATAIVMHVTLILMSFIFDFRFVICCRCYLSGFYNFSF